LVYLLDTNVISELRKRKPHGGVEAWFKAYGVGESNLSAVSFYEMQAGVERTRRQDSTKATELDAWIRTVAISIPVLPLGAVEARMTAYLMRGESNDLLLDAMIAATALANDLTVVTRNTRDFERFDVALVNPFEFKG
jgi:hypothetical protein